MSKNCKSTRNKQARSIKAGRAGAAAFAVGLFLAAPAAVAAADTQDDTSSGSARTARADSAAAKAPANRGANRYRTGAGSAADPARSAGVPRSSAANRTPHPAAAVTSARSGRDQDSEPQILPRVDATAPALPSAATNEPADRGTPDVAGAIAASGMAAVPTTVARPAAAQLTTRRLLGDQEQSAISATAAVQASADAPVMRAAANQVTAAPAAQVMQDTVIHVVRQILNTLHNFAVDLPAGPGAAFLEGGLLMLRRSLFNEAPRVTPSPQTTSEDGKIEGRIGAFDLEGDTLSYAVTGAPQYGTVEVDETGKYSYTPGSTSSGLDSFTVRVAPQQRSWHIFDLGGDGSREVTITIGAANAYDDPDIAVNLSDTAGHITVRRGLFGFTGSVTLTNLTDDTQGVWLDTAGGFGGITVKELAQNYQAFQKKAAESGATVDLHLAYIDADESRKALVLNQVQISVNADGNYVLTGGLAPDPEIELTEVDAWDVTGKAFQAYFDAFRKTYNLDPGQLSKFKTVELDFTGADLYLDTITPLSYSQAGLYAHDSESRAAGTPAASPAAPTQAPISAAPASAPYASLVAARASVSPVNVALSVGQSVYIGRQNGTVEVWNSGSSEKQVLAGLSEAGAPPWGWADQANGKAVEVTTLTRYDRVLKDQTGQTVAGTFTGYIRGDELTVTGLGIGSTVQVGSVITAPGVAAGTIITGFVPKNVSQANCSSATGCTGGAAAGGVEGATGTYKVSIAQSVGASTSSPEVPAGIAFTQQTLSGDVIPAVAPAIVVGLSNGSIQMYSPSASSAGVGTGGWTELHGFESGWGGVKTVMPYLDGFVVGLDNGYVRQWIGPTTNAATGSDANVPSTWKNNWDVLYKPGTSAPKYDGTTMSAFNPSAAVTVMMPFRDRPDICPGDSGKGACSGFLVGRADGSVLKFNEGAGGVGKPGWETLYETAQNSPVVNIVEYKKLIGGNTYLPSFAFALANGYIGEWKWEPKNDNGAEQKGKYGVERIGSPGMWGNGNSITSMTQLDRGFVVGLKNSSIQLRDASSNAWIELRNDGWSGGTGDNAVTTMIPFVSNGVTASGKQGVIAGLSNGSIQAWTGDITGTKSGNPWAQNNWIQLRGTDWQSTVTAMAPAVGSGINLNGDAVTRDGVIVGFANGSVQKWSGVVTGGAPLGYISDGTQPAVFSGSISGTTLTVEQVETGNISDGAFVVGGPTDGTKITGFLTGTGGAGTYSVNQSQTWPSGSLTAGRSSGNVLILSLPAAYLSNGGLDPASLVGASVSGINVAEGTEITKYVGTAGLPAGQAKYEVSTWNLVGAERLTISGLPNAGERDWTQLEAAPRNSAEAVLGPVPSLADFTCDTNWRCTQSGTLQQAVDFGKTLAASGNPWSGSTSLFGTQAGVGSADDPIFGDSLLSPYPNGGTTYTLAFRKEFSPDALNYTVGGSAPIDFNGSVSLSSNCGAGGPAQCSILTVDSVTTPNKTVADIKEGMALEPSKAYQLAGLKSGTPIGALVANTTNQFYIDGFTPSTDIGANIDTRLAGMSAQTPPSLKVGIDVNPLGYGYVVVPDGFFPKFKPGQWSLGVLLATEIGPSLEVQAQVTAPEKDFSLASIRSPGPLGFDSFILSAGAKLGADVTVNGLPEDKTSVTAYAYAVPGMLFTYNTEGAQGQVQAAFNYYLDANASEFKALSGATAKAYLTPYVNLLYGILIPPSVPLVGGWSLFSVSGGFENPITASLCVDGASSCPTADKETGATASLTFGSSGALTFRAGLLDGITSALSYQEEVPLYQIPSYTTVLA